MSVDIYFGTDFEKFRSSYYCLTTVGGWTVDK